MLVLVDGRARWVNPEIVRTAWPHMLGEGTVLDLGGSEPLTVDHDFQDMVCRLDNGGYDPDDDPDDEDEGEEDPEETGQGGGDAAEDRGKVVGLAGEELASPWAAILSPMNREKLHALAAAWGVSDEAALNVAISDAYDSKAGAVRDAEGE